MAKFHINAKGEAGLCRAKVRSCPYGTEEEHYGSPQEARAAYEEARSAVPELFHAPRLTDGSFTEVDLPEPLDLTVGLPPDPLAEAVLPPEQYRGLSPSEQEELLWEEQQEERLYELEMERQRTERWRG